VTKLRFLTTAAAAALLASCGSGGNETAEPTPSAAVTTPEPDPVAMSFLPAAIRAFGTEPFWSVEIGKDELTYTTPENLQGGE